MTQLSQLMPVGRRRIANRYLVRIARTLLIVCSVLLASLAALVSTSPIARADTKTDPSTTGTASTVSPSTGRRRRDDHVHGLWIPGRCDGPGPH